MKKILQLTVLLSLFFIACDPGEDEIKHPLAVESVAAENQSLVVKFSGTRCGPCGSWGWQMLDDLGRSTAGKGLPLTAYGDNFVAQGFITNEATTLQGAWGAGGFPHFGANGSVTTVDRSQGVSTTAEKNEIVERANTHAAATVQVNTGVNFEIVDGVLNLKYKVKAFEAQSDDVYLSLYIVEDKAVGSQSGHPDGANTQHKYVLRKEILDANAYGISLGTLSSGQEVEGDASYELDSSWDEEHIHVYAVNRTKSGSTYTFVNASEGTQIK